MHRPPKVFGIGFHKTATSSLANALYVLGYNVCGYFGNDDPEIAQTALPTAYDLADRFDAAQDMPWPVLYKELDARYPGSKFVLTVRPTEKWIKSVVKHFKQHHIDSHIWIYGVPTALGYEQVYIDRYERHNREVQDYFRDRPDDLLVMDITKGAGWAELCPFLGSPIPDVPFPLQNSADQKSSQLLQRGTRFLQYQLEKRILPASKENHMPRTVTAAFARDILHFHYAGFADIMTAVQRLTDAQFLAVMPGTGRSVQQLLKTQIELERAGLAALTGQPAGADPVELAHVDDAVILWTNLRFAWRAYLANADDDLVNRRLPGQTEYVWEMVMHLFNEGSARQAQLRLLLESFNEQLPQPDFLQFFHEAHRWSPGRVMAGVRQRLGAIVPA
ncbi:MAG: hypothetical protein KDE34_21135 [Anaerolineales bacterium]|nr:hypothetical protein [Anaerolineales bacterium]